LRPAFEVVARRLQHEGKHAARALEGKRCSQATALSSGFTA
jgi:hypothetical protein